MRDYELTYIVHPQVDQEELAVLIEEVKTLVESTGGTVQKVEPWGSRRLAYPIERVWEGQYVFMQVGLDPEGITELERRLKLKEPVIRHLIVRADEDQE